MGSFCNALAGKKYVSVLPYFKMEFLTSLKLTTSLVFEQQGFGCF